MSPSAFEQAKLAILAIDLAKIQSEREAFELELERIADARSRGEAKLDEVREGLASINQPNGANLARALLEDETAKGPVGRDTLLAEQDALRAADRQLCQMADAARSQICSCRDAENRLFAEAMAPAVEAIVEKAVVAASELRKAWGEMRAISFATRRKPLEMHKVQTAFEGPVQGPDSLLGHVERIEIDSELYDLLTLIAERGGQGQAVRLVPL